MRRPGNIIPMTGTGFKIKDLSTGEFITQDVYYPNPETLDVLLCFGRGLADAAGTAACLRGLNCMRWPRRLCPVQ